MRDLVILAVVYGSLPFIPFRPFYGLCVFAWLAYMRPHDLAWGVGGHRFSMLVMAATIFGVVLHLLFPGVLGRERPARWHSSTLLIVALGVWVAITAKTAVAPELTRLGGFDYVDFEKTLLVALLTTGLVSSFLRFRILVGVIAFSLGFLGLKTAVFGLLKGGVRIVEGPGGFMIDNNAYALALNMAIPLLLAIGTTERHPFVRYSALAMIPATALAMIFCFSRGGYLTLAAIACAIVFRSGRPVLASIVLVAGIGLLFATGAGFQDQIVRRTSTIADFEEDASASARILEWGTALRIFEDYPLFGVGPNNLRAVHARYSTFDHYKVTHNSFLQILVDSGLPAFILFVCLFFTSLWKLEKLRRSPTVPEKVPVYAGCFQIAFCAYFVGGFLLNMAYFDLFYELLALTATLEILAGSMRAAQPTLKLLTPNTDRWWESQPAT